MAAVTPLTAADRDRWAELWRGYLTFYETELADEMYTHTWSRILDPDGAIRALGVRDDEGRLVGITHYFYHPHAWSPKDACYLQDLFVDPAYRNRGVARALIAGVADAARAKDALRLYWTTHETNATARALYEKVAKYTGFVRYDVTL
jgi:GNAT superfamily N-acetyltransferase